MQEHNLEKIAKDIKIYTASFLDNTALVNLCRVNKSWFKLLTEDKLLKERLDSETSYQPEQHENICTVLSRLQYLKSLSKEQLFQHFVNNKINHVLIKCARFRPSNYSKIDIPCSLDLKLLIMTNSLLDSVKESINIKYDYLRDDVSSVELSDLINIYVKKSKLLRKYIWKNKLLKHLENIQYGNSLNDFLADFLNSCNKNLPEFNYFLFDYDFNGLLDILYTYNIDIYSPNVDTEILNLYSSNQCFKNSIIAVLHVFYTLCYSNTRFASFIFRHPRERVHLTQNELMNLGAQYPEIGYQLINQPELRANIPDYELKQSKPSVPSRICGAIGHGFVAFLLTPFMYLMKSTCADWGDSSGEDGMVLYYLAPVLSLLLLPAAFYGLIRGAHLGFTKGILGGDEILNVLMEQKMYETYKNWDKRPYRTNTVADCAAQYHPTVAVDTDAAKEPLLSKAHLSVLRNYSLSKEPTVNDENIATKQISFV